MISVTENDDRSELEKRLEKTECCFREMRGLLWRITDNFEAIRFGIFAMIGANLVLIAVLLLK